MITFSIALILLVVGYWIYGSYINKLFAPDPNRKTPALTMTDGVDFIPLPTWKIFMIQFLNIAGLGPIFGAIMGAQFGTASYLWIVLEQYLPVRFTIFWQGHCHSAIPVKVCRRS